MTGTMNETAGVGSADRLSPHHHCKGVNGMPRPSVSKTCLNHSDRKSVARGLCPSCYNGWRRENVPGVREKQRAYHSTLTAHLYRQRPSIRFHKVSRMLRSRYGLTRDEFDALLIAQSGRCAICDRADRNLNVDHCHTSTRVRGLLCQRCNILIGYLDNTPDVVDKARAWLAGQ